MSIFTNWPWRMDSYSDISADPSVPQLQFFDKHAQSSEDWRDPPRGFGEKRKKAVVSGERRNKRPDFDEN